jgi:hypothetical protein
MATSAGFAHFGYLGGSFSGSIEAYDSVEIPEATACATLAALVVLLGRRKITSPANR